jgi:hypothetical protein
LRLDKEGLRKESGRPSVEAPGVEPSRRGSRNVNECGQLAIIRARPFEKFVPARAVLFHGGTACRRAPV